MQQETKEGVIYRYGATWDDIGFPGVNLNRGDTKFSGCPICEEMGKNNKTKDVSINGVKGYGHCWKCGTKFYIARPKNSPLKDKEYTVPKLKYVGQLTEPALEYLEIDRGLSREALSIAKIYMSRDNIAFPYIVEGKIVNVKYRGLQEKTFFQEKNALPTMYLHDFCRGKKNIIIVEGEMDALSFLTAILSQGMQDDWGVTSVNDGAPNENDKNIDKKLQCFTNSVHLFEEAEVVILATDNDPNGRRLAHELTRRIDNEKIKTIDFGKAKDANQVLIEQDELTLLELIENATQYVPSGIISAGNIREQILYAFDNGFAKGSTTHFPSIDKVWTIRPGDVTILTAYNNEGKSLLMNQIALLKGNYDGWKSGFWTPENMPHSKFVLTLAHSFVGKPFIGELSSRKMNKAQLNNAIDFIDSTIFIVDPDDNSIEAILEKMKYLVRVHGIRMVVIDPFNQLDWGRSKSESIDEYVSRFMTTIKRFAVKYDVAFILIVHQNPPKSLTQDGNYPRPSKYRIKNGGTFSDKTDNVIAIHRPFLLSDPADPMVDFISLKIKDIGLTGDIGRVSIKYDAFSNRYMDVELNYLSPFDVVRSEDKIEAINYQKEINFLENN